MASSQPRTLFIKSLPLDCEILQVGPEFGSIEVYLLWPPPVRKDLQLFALTNSSAVQRGAFKQVEIVDFGRPNLVYGEKKFGAVVCSMMLQRLADPSELLAWICEHTQTHARIFLEWPSPFSTLLPSRADLKSKNIDLGISNISDDQSNVQIHERSRIVSSLSKAGFFIESQGYLSFPFVENEILAHCARDLKDAYALQTVFWSKTRWVQYLVGVRL